MAHKATAIRAGDAPHYLAVMHTDGSIGEVQVSIGENDALIVTVETSQTRGHTVIVDGRESTEPVAL